MVLSLHISPLIARMREDSGGMVGRFPHKYLGRHESDKRRRGLQSVRVRRLLEDVHHDRLGQGEQGSRI